MPIITRRKEKALRVALSKLYKKRGIDNRYVSLILEPKAVVYIVVRAIKEGKLAENNRSYDVKFYEDNRLFIVDTRGFTTVSNCKSRIYARYLRLS